MATDQHKICLLLFSIFFSNDLFTWYSWFHFYFAFHYKKLIRFLVGGFFKWYNVSNRNGIYFWWCEHIHSSFPLKRINLTLFSVAVSRLCSGRVSISHTGGDGFEPSNLLKLILFLSNSFFSGFSEFCSI